MPSRDRLLTIGARRGDRLASELGDHARELRSSLGLSRRQVAATLGISESKLARWERGIRPYPDLWDATRMLRVLGEDLIATWYPAGGSIRDAGHAALISAFLALVPSTVPRWLEAPMPRQGDLRAWDVVLQLEGRRLGVAAETRLRDWQALLRREQLKARDSGVERLLLVLLASHANRRAVRDAGAALTAALPLDGRTILPALAIPGPTACSSSGFPDRCHVLRGNRQVLGPIAKSWANRQVLGQLAGPWPIARRWR